MGGKDCHAVAGLYVFADESFGEGFDVVGKGFGGDGFPAGDGAGCVAHRGLKRDVAGGLLEPVFEDVCCVLVCGAGVYQQGA